MALVAILFQHCQHSGFQLWSVYEEPKVEVVQESEVLERKISYKMVVVTEVTPELHFYAQNTETGKYQHFDLMYAKTVKPYCNL
jgi:hypothetical protein